MSANEESAADINNLQDSFNKQQEKITALKELVRKSEVAHGKTTNTAQQKVKNIAQRLTKLKFKARGIKIQAENVDEADLTTNDSLSPVKPNMEEQTTGREKFQLLRTQMEENRARMAQRASSKQHLEQLVTQLKEKFDVTQQSLDDTAELGKSMSDLSSLHQTTTTHERHKSATDLSLQQPFNVDKERIKFLENRIRLLTKQLEKEKQNKQQTLLDQLEKSEKHTADLETQLIQLMEDFESLTKQVHVLENMEVEQQPVKVTAVVTDDVEIVKVELLKQVQELQDNMQQLQLENGQLKQDLKEKEKLVVTDVNIAEKLEALEATIESQRLDLCSRQEIINKQEEELMEKNIEFNVLNANLKVLEEKLEISNKNKPLFPSSDEAANPALITENQQLKQKLDESNKLMIKLKLKCKQTEKQLENFKKTNNIPDEFVQLQKQYEELQQKYAELEVEKGQWQLQELQQVDKQPEDIIKKQEETIKMLEQQLYEFTEKLETVQQQLDSYEQTNRVKNEMSVIQLEEELQELQKTLDLKAHERDDLKDQLKQLQFEKDAVEKKLAHYVTENIELLDKLGKLSKSSSSAESIEIVERLTQQERAELAAYNKQIHDEPTTSVSELTQTDLAPEVSESIIKLREESSELMNKIELFTTERREVLEKMEALTNENHELLQQINKLTDEKQQFELNLLQADNDKTLLTKRLEEFNKEKQLLVAQVAEASKQSVNLSKELTSMQKSTEVVAALDSQEADTLFDRCETSLTKLNLELEAYRKANDKSAKFNACKKLFKEAKNAYTQLSELLQKVKEASNAVETVTVVETVVAVTAPNGKALAEYEQLTAQNRELQFRVDNLIQELDELRDSHTTEVSEWPAITQSTIADERKTYEEQLTELQAVVEELRLDLQKERLAVEALTANNSRLEEEISELKESAKDFDALMSEKDLTFEKQIAQLQRMRKELEDNCHQLITVLNNVKETSMQRTNVNSGYSNSIPLI